MTSSKSELTDFSTLLGSGPVRHNRRDIIRVAAISAAAALVPSAIFARPSERSFRLQNENEAGITLRLPFNPYGQEVTVDPARTVNWGPYWVMLPYLWSGLLRFDENGAVEVDLAESVEPNDDGSVWTATLREGVAFADGTAILAEHVVQSWTRALDSSRLSPMFRFMEPVVGASEIANGENTPLGVKASDDRTIEITLTTPLAHFPSYLATFGYAVVHPGLDSTDEPVGLEEACSGPWTITTQTDDEIRMIPNPHHWSEPSQDVAEIIWQIAPGGTTDATILDWYQNEEVAVADAPSAILAAIAEDDALQQELRRAESQASMLVLALDFHQVPFNDVRIRRAVAAAIDRATWASEIEQNSYEPASSFSPPVLADIANYEAPTDMFNDDPAVLLAAAEYDPSSSEDEIILFQPASDTPEHIDRTAQLLAMIGETTGLNITHDSNLTSEQITAARQDLGGLQMALVQWQLDSDQPSILGIMSQTSTFNAGWVNWEPGLEDSGDFTPGADSAKYDELITAAIANLDEIERNAHYAAAEALLLKNAVLIPIGFWNPSWLQKPWLLGTRQGPWSGSTPVRIDADVSIDMDAFPDTLDA